MIDLYFWPTPNGKKVTILLEESGIEYRIVPLDIGRGDQFSDEFLRLNPNHRMPAIIDTAPAGGGPPISVFESAAIMMYLAEKSGRFWPQDARQDQSYAVRRFTDEANRLYGVLNQRLYDRRYLAGDEYSIADMISYPWTVGWQAQGQDIDEFKYVKRWFDEVGNRPAVKRGMAAGAELATDPASLPPAEQERRRKILYNQRARPVPAA